MSERDPNGVVTVVVTSRNSADTLAACLASIRGQTYPQVQLVVVDNDSPDESPRIAREYADIVLDAGPERSAQRNRGVAAGHGEFVLVIDADMVLTPRVVEQCVAEHRKRGATAVVIPEKSIGDGFLARAKALERRCYLGDDAIEAPRFFPRSTFEAYGGYDEDMTGPEDWDLPARMREKERPGRVDAIILHNEGRLRLVPLLQKKFYYGKSAYRYVRRHPELARRQLIPFRASFIRHWRLLAGQPVLATAMIAMKLAEFTAGGFGALTAAAAARPKR